MRKGLVVSKTIEMRWILICNKSNCVHLKMQKVFIASLFLELMLCSCSVGVPMSLAKPEKLIALSLPVKKMMETPAYAGLDPDGLETREDVSNTFVNDKSVSFRTKDHGDTWIFEWEADKSNARNDEPLPSPKTLSFHFEGDSVVSWDNEGVNLNALTKRGKILVGFVVGLGLDVAIEAASLGNLSLFPNGITLAPINY